MRDVGMLNLGGGADDTSRCGKGTDDTSRCGKGVEEDEETAIL